MMKIWDYIMRRKSLFLLILGIFAIGNFIGFSLLHGANTEKDITYIQIEKWGQPDDVEIPRTGGSDQGSIIAVMYPEDVVNIKSPVRQENEPQIASTDHDPYTSFNESNTSTLTHIPEFLPEAGANITNIVADSIQNNTPTFWNVISNVFLAVAGISILILGGYLVYQHFMR